MSSARPRRRAETAVGLTGMRRVDEAGKFRAEALGVAGGRSISSLVPSALKRTVSTSSVELSRSSARKALVTVAMYPKVPVRTATPQTNMKLSKLCGVVFVESA